MLGTAIIVFREVLEAALIITLVLAATRGIAGRHRWVSGGLVAGLALAGLVALLAEQISMLADGLGQELFNAAILFTAVLMLGWHNIWMKQHARELVAQIKSTSQAIQLGEQSMLVIAGIIGLAILREGAEVVLFMHGMLAMGNNTAGMAMGGLLGLGLGIGVGALLYFGLLRIPTRHLFQATGIMILLLAAGLASQAAAYLVQADILPSLGGALWDTSWLISDQSIVGNVLHILVGYTAHPMGIQLVFYFVTLLIIGGLMYLVGKEKPVTLQTAGTLATAVFALLLLPAINNDAHASHKVYSPNVELDETELEFRGHTTFDKEAIKDDQQKYIIEYGHGMTDYWFTSVFGEIEKEQSGEMEFEAVAWENIFQLTEQGEYFVDVGFYVEYEYALESYNNDKLELKLLLEKNSGKWVNTFNVVLERELGGNAPGITELGYAWRISRLVSKGFTPSLEIYGNTGELGKPNHSEAQDHRAGPVISGEYHMGGTDKFVFEAGYLFGLTDAAPEGTLKFTLEYEF